MQRTPDESLFHFELRLKARMLCVECARDCFKVKNDKIVGCSGGPLFVKTLRICESADVKITLKPVSATIYYTPLAGFNVQLFIERLLTLQPMNVDHMVSACSGNVTYALSPRTITTSTTYAWIGFVWHILPLEKHNTYNENIAEGFISELGGIIYDVGTILSPTTDVALYKNTYRVHRFKNVHEGLIFGGRMLLSSADIAGIIKLKFKHVTIHRMPQESTRCFRCSFDVWEISFTQNSHDMCIYCVKATDRVVALVAHPSEDQQFIDHYRPVVANKCCVTFGNAYKTKCSRADCEVKLPILESILVSRPADDDGADYYNFDNIIEWQIPE